jgi:hypothetical protein
MKRLLISIPLSIALCACDEFVDIDPPTTELISATVFEQENTTDAALADVYFQLTQSNSLGSGGPSSVGFYAAMSADETINYDNGASTSAQEYQQFNDNTLEAANSLVLGLWTEFYQVIYKSNAIIDGVQNSNSLPQEARLRFVGEAKFLRAFCYFYLTALFGDVPLVLTPDYRQHSNISRTPANVVFEQIVADLTDAKSTLPLDYSRWNNERVRPTSSAASAMLARVYLLTHDWINAEAESTLVINNSALYQLAQLDQVFLKNSPEAIWQLSRSEGNAWDAIYLMPEGSDRPSYASLQPTLVNAFSSEDQRRSEWIGSSSSETETYFFPTKYKNGEFTPITEYTTVLRLAEQYLIRAEARAKQGKFSGISSATSDINTIRDRAGLPEIQITSEQQAQNTIINERRLELFTEWGHRWIDLIRNDVTNQALPPLKPLWSPHAVLYPIPELQISNDPAMSNSQNPGY